MCMKPNIRCIDICAMHIVHIHVNTYTYSMVKCIAEVQNWYLLIHIIHREVQL